MTGGWSYVWAAYLLTWGTLLAYAWHVRGRTRQAVRDLAEPIPAGAVYPRGDTASGAGERVHEPEEGSR